MSSFPPEAQLSGSDNEPGNQTTDLAAEAQLRKSSLRLATETTPLKGGRGFLGVTRQAAMVRIITCVISLAEGYDSAIFGAVATHMMKEEFSLTPWSLGVLAATVPLAAMIGAPIAGLLTNSMGRKPLLFLVCLLVALGSLIQALSPTHTVIVLGIGRFILGLGVGAGLTTVAVYVAECSPANVRGLLVSLEELFINIGISFAFGASWALHGPQGFHWRHAMFLGVSFPLLSMAVLTFAPESPRYHMLCGRLEDARLAMEQLGVSQEEADQTMRTWSQVSDDSAARDKPFEGMQIHQKSVILAIFVAIGPMLVGIVPMHSLMGWVLSSKLPEEKALRWATIISVLKFTVLIPVCFDLLDRVGRRPLLCFSAFAFAAAAAFTAVAFTGGLSGEVVAIGYGVVLCSFSAGIGPATFPYIAEVLPTAVRGQGTGVALMCSKFISCLWMLYFPTLFSWRPEMPFILVSVAAALYFIFYFTMCPETARMTLEDLQVSFAKGAKV